MLVIFFIPKIPHDSVIHPGFQLERDLGVFLNKSKFFHEYNSCIFKNRNLANVIFTVSSAFDILKWWRAMKHSRALTEWNATGCRQQCFLVHRTCSSMYAVIFELLSKNEFGISLFLFFILACEINNERCITCNRTLQF